jgi:hypothetical protein
MLKFLLRLQKAVYLLMEEVNKNDIQCVFDWVDGKLYLRLSANIYNTLRDYEVLVPVLKRLIETCTPYPEL